MKWALGIVAAGCVQLFGCGGGDSHAGGSTDGPDHSAGGLSQDGGSQAERDAATGASRGATMSFFATSRGSGEKGGDYGGLAGADAFCQQRAAAAGAGQLTWRAYLCTSGVDARDRIGSGPWSNSAGDKIADNVDRLHADGVSNGDPQLILDENGESVPGVEVDILTGCEPDGTVRAGATCRDWTSASPDDVAMVGHADIPPPPFDTVTSWNSAHTSEGCDEMGLLARLGAGRIYCFATDGPGE